MFFYFASQHTHTERLTGGREDKGANVKEREEKRREAKTKMTINVMELFEPGRPHAPFESRPCHFERMDSVNCSL